jgi:two-component system, OmpR family, response regulator
VTVPHRILVVDDDPHIRDVIGFALEKAGFDLSIAKDGADALAQFRRQPPALIVLDVGMPEMDGLEVCRQIRKTHETPILFLSARDEEIDRVLGLEMGGDDYVTKPFSPRELVARINAILKRATKAAKGVDDVEVAPLHHGLIELRPGQHEAMFDGAGIDLTGTEFAMLQRFMQRPRQVLSRDQLMDGAYAGNIHVSDRTIDSHIRNIRAKFQAAGCTAVIETVHGVGFRLGPCGRAA